MSIVNVKDLGVIGDGATLETKAIQKAINEVKDGDTLVFPKGYYVTGTLALRSNITIRLEKGAELVGSRNIEHYYACGFYHNEMKDTVSLIYALDCENITFEGEGKIQLSGDAFVDFDTFLPPELEGWDITKEYSEQMVIAVVKRPTQPIFFNNCKNIKITGIKVFNSPCWTMVFSNCENIEVSNVYVDNHNRIPNNDGVHFSASRNIVVKNSTFLCGDDCFAATCITNWDGICENMVISDCLMSSRSAAIRFGHLESKVRNIVVKNVKIIRSNRALAVFCGDNGYVKNAVFENIEADTKIHAGYWWGKGEPIVVCGADVNGEISDVVFKDCKFVHENPALFVGNNGNVKNVILTNCQFKQEDGSTTDYYKNKMDLQPNIPDLIPTVFDKNESVFVKEVDGFKVQ